MVGLPRALLAAALLPLALVPAAGATSPLPCQPGVTVETGPGSAHVDWPDVNGTYYYNVSAVRLHPEPVVLHDAAAGGFEGSEYTFHQPAGNYSYSVRAFDTEHRVIAEFCAVEATVPPGTTEVPFFTGPLGMLAALATIGIVGALMVVRRAGDEE